MCAIFDTAAIHEGTPELNSGSGGRDATSQSRIAKFRPHRPRHLSICSPILDYSPLLLLLGRVTAKLAARNWEMISAVGQMLGAVGVIIPIIYLAAQIRNQNQESSPSDECSNIALERLNRTLAENPDLAALWQVFEEKNLPFHRV